MRYFAYTAVILVFMTGPALFADSKDFNYKPMHQKIHYKEEFYSLYNEWLYSDPDSISRNIYFLEMASVVPFDHPIKALTPITNETQYERYKNLLMMHICSLLTKGYIDYGYLYMKEHIYFFNAEYKKEYLDGYDIAEYYFHHARNYWDKTVGYANSAGNIKGVKTDMLYIEDELFRIQSGDLDYYKIVDNLMGRISNNRTILANISNQ
ncbi:MAG: hypothetical protein ABSG94_06500 [Brevinematales bacterium]|jgi:hypothetical protein